MELRSFIKSSISSFVREQRELKQLPSSVRLGGYTLKEAEENGHLIPLRDLMPILEYISTPGKIASWWFDFQMEAHRIKIRTGR